MDRSGSSLIQGTILIQYMPEDTEDNHDKSQSGQLVSGSRSELRTSLADTKKD
jgi:hypothetical protein